MATVSVNITKHDLVSPYHYAYGYGYACRTEYFIAVIFYSQLYGCLKDWIFHFSNQVVD